MLNEALSYLNKHGFSVFPVSREKKPLVAWERFQREKTTPKQITDWWANNPQSNIGIATGMVSGVVVVDIDNKPDKGITLNAGLEALRAVDIVTDNVPRCSTPSGGLHLYYKCPDENLRNNTGAIPGCDLRANGGYVVVPPSVNGNGKPYQWIQQPKGEYPALPSLYLESIAKANRVKKTLQDAEEMFSEGRRDEDLFHVANTLVRAGLPDGEILKILKTLASSWGEGHLEEWFTQKVQSALNRDERKNRRLTEEVRKWIDDNETRGVFHSSDISKSLQISSKEELRQLSVALGRLSKEGLITRHGNRYGTWRVVESEAERIDLQAMTHNPLDIRFPLGIEKFVDIFPTNIIVASGVYNSGKTGFLLNFCDLNMDRKEIHYFSSEMDAAELKNRLKYSKRPLEQWNTKVNFYERNDRFNDVIRPDAINIIDYLELEDEFYKVIKYIREIHNQLKGGIAIIAIQKKPGEDVGYGGHGGQFLARLTLAIDYNKMKMVKVKNKKNPLIDPNGMVINFNIMNGYEFIPTGDWVKP